MKIFKLVLRIILYVIVIMAICYVTSTCSRVFGV